MGWFRGPYYYRSARQGRRVVQEYVGRGTLARLAAQGDADDRRRRERRARAGREERARVEALDAPVLELCGLADALAHAALLAAGFHRHKRQWRRRRMGT